MYLSMISAHLERPVRRAHSAEQRPLPKSLKTGEAPWQNEIEKNSRIFNAHQSTENMTGLITVNKKNKTKPERVNDITCQEEESGATNATL